MTWEKQNKKILIIDIENLHSFIYYINSDLHIVNLFETVFWELHKKLSKIGIINQYYLTKLKTDNTENFVVFLGLNKKEILIKVFEKYELTKTEENLVKKEFDLINLYKQAITFAKKAHGEQTYDVIKLPYFYHLRQADKFVDYFISEIPYNYVMKLKIASILHDILEDTMVKYEDIFNIFGKEISDIVLAVTKDEEYNDGGDYLDYEEIYYNQVLNTPYATYIKMADKCANNRQTTKIFRHKRAEKSLKQHEIFKKIIYDKFDSLIIKNYLDSLMEKIRIRNNFE